MKKIFIVAGELSGDRLGAWYVEKLKREEKCYFAGVGGNFLKNAGVTLYERFEKLNVVGLIEIIRHIKFLNNFLKKVVTNIITENFDEVIVIDFPGFNLRLIKKLKKLNPSIKITYLSPPQLWIWGKWRLRTLKRYCDDVIVLYPFEVAWYKERGVQARWIEYPFYEKFISNERKVGEGKSIALIPGSRLIEIKRLLPLFVKVIQRFKLAHPEVKVVLPLAESIDREVVEKILRRSGLGRWGREIIIVQGEQEKLEALRSCCVAITKPGTITLELALLSIPAVVAYKASWMTYFVARLLVSIEHMSLPNLLLGQEVYPECIQSDCSLKKIGQELETVYSASINNTETHQVMQKKLGALCSMLVKQ